MVPYSRKIGMPKTCPLIEMAFIQIKQFQVIDCTRGEMKRSKLQSYQNDTDRSDE